MKKTIAVLLLAALGIAARGQTGGSIQGEITLNSTGMPLHNATVIIPKLGRVTETKRDGRYTFPNVPAGKYEVMAHMHHLTAEKKTVEVSAGAEAVVDFQLSLEPLRQEVTVTATGREETTLEAVQTVASLSSMELANRSGSTSLGDLLEGETGVAKRSFGPGTTRPVVRGFDGDRVLVLEDGVRTGTLSSQSGDHGEPIDVNMIERVEVVRGPGTLLYGSNAIGGVINTISSHHQLHEHPHEGLRGHLTGLGGSNNGQGGASGNFEYGAKSWLLSGGGGGQRTGDYSSAAGRAPNSGSEMKHANVGVARYGEKTSFSFGYGVQDGRYGVPYASEFGEHSHGHGHEEEEVDVGWRRHRARLSGSIRNLGSFVEQFNLKLSYTDWNHKEMEGEEVGTEFFNKQFVYRGEFQQRRRGALSGRFGFWGMGRDYEAVGEEALAPPVEQNAVAVFGLEQLELERLRLQFGGRLEHNSYEPAGLRSRSFTGLSGGAGINVPLWKGGAFAANYTHSHRAPAMEELYNKGPHVGNVTYEVGDPNLKRETSDGVDVSLRHQSARLRAEANLFYYRMGEFIYLAPSGEMEHGLPVGEITQGDSRFLGVEAKLATGLHRYVWLKLGFDAVDAELMADGGPLPRIPPVSGRAGLEIRYKGLSLKPEVQAANAQFQLAQNETRTAGYAAANLAGTYTIPRQHTIHVFGVHFFNMGNRLYRNHLSFIKELAPEMGRGVRFSYTLHFF